MREDPEELPGAEETHMMRDSSPTPRRRSASPENGSKQAFDLIEVASFLVSKFQRAHGDRTVALALLNPELKEAWPDAPSPRDVWRVIEPLQVSDLWNLFKEAGGLSKEIEPYIDEGAQHEALKALWGLLLARGA